MGKIIDYVMRKIYVYIYSMCCVRVCKLEEGHGRIGHGGELERELAENIK